jgi:hypothetical protein
MPLYNTHCVACAKDDIRRLSFAEYDQISNGTVPLECECGGGLELVFDPSAVSFVLRDGEAGGWTSKATKENAYRTRRRAEMGRRERDHVKPNKLVPNFNGQVTGSWAEAKDAAYQSTYQRLNREHGARTASDAAREAAKTYDTHVKRESP